MQMPNQGYYQESKIKKANAVSIFPIRSETIYTSGLAQGSLIPVKQKKLIIFLIILMISA